MTLRLAVMLPDTAQLRWRFLGVGEAGQVLWPRSRRSRSATIAKSIAARHAAPFPTSR
jgi:hypothetical protein